MLDYLLPILIILLFLPQIHYFRKTRDYKKMNVGRKWFVKLKQTFDDHSEMYITNTDGHDIFVRLYENENPKGIVQIVHGMAEHSYNYLDFIKFLVDNGYTVIAHDHRGHGKSISEKYPNGYMRLSEELIDDTYVVNKFVQSKHGDLPVYMIGHSMGSMVARTYLKNHDDTIDKLILIGTVEHSKIAGFGVFLGNIISFYFGEYQAAILSPLLPGDGRDTWISYNMDNVIEKRNDSFRVFQFLERGVVTIIDLNNKMSKVNEYKLQNPKLKIHSATGADDIVTGSDIGLESSIKTLRQAGYNKISQKVYPEMQHEILNENNKEIVYEDILEFLDE